MSTSSRPACVFLDRCRVSWCSYWPNHSSHVTSLMKTSSISRPGNTLSFIVFVCRDWQGRTFLVYVRNTGLDEMKPVSSGTMVSKTRRLALYRAWHTVEMLQHQISSNDWLFVHGPDMPFRSAIGILVIISIPVRIASSLKSKCELWMGAAGFFSEDTPNLNIAPGTFCR